MKKATVVVLKTLRNILAAILVGVIGFNIYLTTRPAAKTMKAAGIINIPTPFRIGRSFIDYMTVSGSRLYAGYATEGLVGVIDTAKNQEVAAVGGLGRVHGIAVVADRNLGFASSSGDNVVGVFDLNTNQLVQRIPAGDDPDAIIYDEAVHLVYVANHDGKTGMLIDPQALKVVATISLGGEPEYPQADPATGLIYQNLEDTSELVVIDPAKQAVVKRFKLDPGKGPTGLALDAAHHRLFSATSSGKLIVMNAENGAVISVISIGVGCDGAGYDPVLRRVYTANSIGNVTVIQQDSADEYHVIENAPTHLLGHSLVVDPVTHRVYVAYAGKMAAYDPVQ